MLQKLSISDRLCSFELSIHQRILDFFLHNCFQHW